MNTPNSIYEIIFEAVNSSENILSIKELCSLGKVSRSGYYSWISNYPKRRRREEKDREDFGKIKAAYSYRGYDKGVRGIYMRLLHEGTVMNPKKIRRLMRKYGLCCKIRSANPYRRMARAIKTSCVANNLLMRKFEEYGPRVVLLTDITYIPFSGKFAYLSVITDACTKEILAHQLSESLELDFVLETVKMLERDHGKELKTDAFIHSDQGCHYTSYRFIDILKDSGLRQSMSRKGNCWDNAPQESLFGHMKDEVDIKMCRNFDAVKNQIEGWIDYYNNERYSWDLARLSPVEYYRYLMTKVYSLKNVPEPDFPKFKVYNHNEILEEIEKRKTAAVS